jgi:hypothetical protein
MNRWIILCCFLLSGCCRQLITVRTEYLNHQSLASYYVNTPDPQQNCPPAGQRLILKWNLPDCLFEMDDLHLELTMRFGNRKEEKKRIELVSRNGNYIYTLLNDDFFKLDGIQTYKVDLIGNGEVLDEWRHQLWTELIIFKAPEENPEK